MTPVLIQMAAFIACGIGWRLLNPSGYDADTTRGVLAGVVYNLLLPALVFVVLRRSPMGWDALRIGVSASAGIILALLLSWAVYRFLPTDRPTTGALIMAASFGNVTYFGLPVLEVVFGPWAAGVAITYDLLANMPLLLTVGILMAQRFGLGSTDNKVKLGAIAKVPALWAAVAAVLLNIVGAPMPLVLEEWLDRMAAPVVPLMLISVGLALPWVKGWSRRLALLLPALIIQMGVTPLLVAFVATLSGLTGEVHAAVVLEAAMPTMVLGIVICDQYNLNTEIYAEAVTLSTALSLVTLPLWFSWTTG